MPQKFWYLLGNGDHIGQTFDWTNGYNYRSMASLFVNAYDSTRVSGHLKSENVLILHTNIIQQFTNHSKAILAAQDSP